MSSTFSQIYIQIVFAVKGRQSLIQPAWEEDLYKYITGIVQRKQQKMLAINGMADHIHLFMGLTPTCCISDLVREIKKSSNDFIKENSLCSGFYWQNGYGAFSYSHSQLSNVIAYIISQKDHHRKKSFEEEYIQLLKKFEITFEERHLFEWIDTN